MGRRAGTWRGGIAGGALAGALLATLRSPACNGGFVLPGGTAAPTFRRPQVRRSFFGDLFGGGDKPQQVSEPAPIDPNVPFDGGPYAPADFATAKQTFEIVRYPHPALRRENVLVEAFDQRLRQLVDNLFASMYATGHGIGLAAPQVGVNLRVMVYNPKPGNPSEETVFVNPKIIAASSQTSSAKESCLSFPRMTGPVQRPDWVEVEAASWDGCPFRRRIEGFEARLFQHEYDHLDGVVYVDRLADSAKAAVQPELNFLIRDFQQVFKEEEPAL